MNSRVIPQIGGGFLDRFIQTTRDVNMKLAENFGLGEIMTGVS